MIGVEERMRATPSKFAVGIIALAFVMGWPLLAVGNDDARSVQDGVYTRAQASRGRKLYQRRCRTCHEGDEFTAEFMETWSGRSAFELVDLLLATMPEEDPGVGGSESFTDIVAYLFHLNGLPKGEVEMPSDEASLKLILIEGPFGADDGGG